MEDLRELLRLVISGNEQAINNLLLAFKNQTLNLSEQEQVHIYLNAQKNHDAIFVRGLLYGRGYGVPSDSDMAFLLMREAAAKGNSKAIYEVGRHYLEGIGVEKNYQNALEWLQMAADSPHYIPAAMYDLGRIYEQGWGVPIDLVLAQEWFEKAKKKRL